MAEVKITYETLFDLLRREKGRNELQTLDETFYADVLEYLREKMKMIGDESQSALFSRTDFEKNKIQVKNIHKILRELHDLRQKKILNLAMNKIKTGSSLIDTSGLLPEEMKLFEDSVVLLSLHKGNILDKIIGKQYYAPEKLPEEKKAPEKQETHEEKSGIIEIKILSDLPKFVGLDKQIYGPYSKGELVELPQDVAELLTKKGRATKA